MGNSFSQGAQSANALGENFVAGQMAAGSVTVADSALAVTDTCLDGSGTLFTPDFVLYSQLVRNETLGDGYVLSTSTSTMTWTRLTSTAADVIFWIAGNLE